MELDDFKTAWQGLDRRLEQQRMLSIQVLREGKLQSARRGLRPLWWGQLAQIVAGIGLMLLFGPIWFAHRGSLHLMAPALLIHAYGLMFVLLGARTLAFISRIDYASPVIHIQRQLAELRRWRDRVEWPLFGIVGCFIWIPLMLAIFAALGTDLWVAHPNIVYWDIATSVALIGALYAIVRRVRQKGHDFAGNSVLNAQDELAKIARFEGE